MFPAKSDSKIFCHVSSTFVNSDTSIPNADVANLRVKGYLSKDTFSSKFELFSNSIMKRNYLFFSRQKLSLPQASSIFDLRKINGAYLCLIKDMMTLSAPSVCKSCDRKAGFQCLELCCKQSPFYQLVLERLADL